MATVSLSVLEVPYELPGNLETIVIVGERRVRFVFEFELPYDLLENLVTTQVFSYCGKETASPSNFLNFLGMNY
jgi:hypothetical protein